MSGVALALGAATAADSSGDAAPALERPLKVQVLQAEQQSGYEVVREFVGRVEPARSSQLGFERGGLLLAVLVDEGDIVEAGDLIARLDRRELDARRDELRARLASAQALLTEMKNGPRAEVIAAAQAEVEASEARRALAQVDMKRSTDLRDRNAISSQEWDKARFTEREAAARLRAAQSRLDELVAGTRIEQVDAQRALVLQLEAEIATLDVQLDKCDLKAPFAGTVSLRIADEGKVLDVGDPVVELLETAHLDVRVGLAGDAARSVAVGDQLPFRINNQPYQGTVRAIRPDRGSRTRTVDAVLRIEEPGPHLRTGDLAKVEIKRSVTEPGVWLPVEALTEGVRGLWACYVVAGASSESASQTHLNCLQ